jgi:hypothetical protein
VLRRSAPAPAAKSCLIGAVCHREPLDDPLTERPTDSWHVKKLHSPLLRLLSPSVVPACRRLARMSRSFSSLRVIATAVGDLSPAAWCGTHCGKCGNKRGHTRAKPRLCGGRERRARRLGVAPVIRGSGCGGWNRTTNPFGPPQPGWTCRCPCSPIRRGGDTSLENRNSTVHGCGRARGRKA